MITVLFLRAILGIVHNPRKNKYHVRKCHTISPKLIFSRIRMRVFKPLYELLFTFRFCRFSYDFPMSFKDLTPELDVVFGRFFRFKVAAPPIWESLQPSTFRRSKPSYDIGRCIVIYNRRVFIICSNKCVCQFFVSFCKKGCLRRSFTGLYRRFE